MNQLDHVKENLTDYVLGIVSDNEKREIALHLTGCPECQKALSEERRLGFLVRDAVSQATLPDSRQLQELMPPFPNKEKASLIGIKWQPRFALVGLLFILVLGAISLQTQIRQETWLGTSPATYPTVMSATDTPTSTLPATTTDPEPMDTEIPTPIARNPLAVPHPAIMPVPAAPIFR